MNDTEVTILSRIAKLAAVVAAIDEWSHEHGAALCPTGPDTFGEGMRAAKAQIRRILERYAASEAM